MKKAYLFILLLVLPLGFETLAQTFEMKATIRPRAEFRNGFKRLRPTDEAGGDTPAFFTEQRSRLNLNYSHEKVKLGVAVQDVRIWGEIGQINKSDALFSVHEAWGQYDFSEKVAVKLGRQELVYDDHRILGSLDWAAQGRSHDALKFMFKPGKSQIDVGVTYNQDANNAEPRKLFGSFYAPNTNVEGFSLGGPKSMQYVYFKNTAGKFGISAILLNTVFQRDESNNSTFVTFGVNPSLKVSDKVKLFGTFYYQAGTEVSNRTVGAYLGSLNLAYKASDKVGLTLGADIVSGNDMDATDTKDKSFNPLFGTHHKFYGFMDYFYVGNPHNDVGLNDYYLKGTFKTGEKTTLIAHAHMFGANGNLINGDGEDAGSYLGTELDLVLNYNIDKNFNFKLGYSQLLADDNMEIIKPGDKSKFTNWAWAMITFNPTLLKITK